MVAGVMIPSPEEISNDTVYLNTVNERNVNSWNCTIQVDGQAIPFKLDTGAEITVVTEETAKGLKEQKMKKSKKRLCGADQKHPCPRFQIYKTANLCSETITPESLRITCY